MKRPDNWDDLLTVAKEHPDLLGALSAIGVQLKRAGGTSQGGVRYRTTSVSGVQGDFSAVTFTQYPTGKWSIIDNKERYGVKYLDAIDVLVKMYGFTFDDAVYALSGGAPSAPAEKPIICPAPTVSDTNTALIAPSADYTRVKQVIAYLTKTRCIPYNVVKELLRINLIYPSFYEKKTDEGKTYINTTCIFPIIDEQKNIVGIDSRTVSSVMKNIKAILPGSDPLYPWGFIAGVQTVSSSTAIYVCESPIDAISLYCLTEESGAYISLAGLKEITLTSVKKKLPGRLVICVDNDEGAEKFRKHHCTEYQCQIPKGNKDWNEMLQAHVNSGGNLPISNLEKIQLHRLFG